MILQINKTASIASVGLLMILLLTVGCSSDLDLEPEGEGGQSIKIDNKKYDFSGAAVFDDGYASIHDEYHREYILTSTDLLPSTTVNDYSYAIIVSAFCTGREFKYGKFSHNEEGDRYGTVFLVGPDLLKYGTGGSFTITDLGNKKVRLEFDVKNFGSSLFKGSYEGVFTTVDGSFTRVLSSS